MEMKNPYEHQDLDLGQGNEAWTYYQTVRISLDHYEALSQHDGDVDALVAEAIDHYLEHLEDWAEPWCGPEDESGEVEYEATYSLT